MAIGIFRGGGVNYRICKIATLSGADRFLYHILANESYITGFLAVIEGEVCAGVGLHIVSIRSVILYQPKSRPPMHVPNPTSQELYGSGTIIRHTSLLPSQCLGKVSRRKASHARKEGGKGGLFSGFPFR